MRKSTLLGCDLDDCIWMQSAATNRCAKPQSRGTEELQTRRAGDPEMRIGGFAQSRL
jgi:hypothetical protein